MKGSIVVVCLVLAAGVALAALPPVAGAGREEQPPLLSAAGAVLSPNEVVLEPALSDPVWMDAPDETLKYDGVNANGIGLTNGGTYRGAVRFTPTFACTVKAVLFYQRDASSNDSVFFYGEDNDSTPGATLAGAGYTGAGGLQWKRVNLNPFIVVPAGTDLWACVRATHAAGTFPIGTDAGPMIRYRSGFISTGGAWQQIADLGLDYSWNIRAIVARVPGLTNDVGVSRIFVPPPAINPGSFAPSCRVVNFGTAAQSGVTVRCRVDSAGSTVYNQTQTTGSIPPGDRAAVTFSPNWNSGPRGANYTVSMFTELGNDENRANDTTRQATYVMSAMPWVDLDTGNCRLTVTAFGAIGYDAPSDAGNGFRYPKGATTSALFYSSFAVGNAETYVADRHFGQPASGGPNTDLVAVESLRPIVPPTGDQQFRCVFTDQGHPSPKGLKVTHNSHMTANPGYDDFVVLAYDIKNEGGSAVNGLYAAIFADFDVGATPTTNLCSTDVARRLTFMRQQSTAYPSVGVKILAPGSAANLSAVDHARYVYPDSAMTDGMKWRHMNGTITLPNSNRAYDWSTLTSAGPFDLAPGESYRFAVAFVGGGTGAEIRDHADSAQSWYDGNVGVVEDPKWEEASHRFTVAPNPFRKSARVRYYSAAQGRLELAVYDAGGRLVEERSADVRPGYGDYLWQPKGLARGVYFLDIKTPDNVARRKVLLLD